MMNSAMTLKILLPYRVLAEIGDVVTVVAETTAGCMGILPNRLDCMADLVPGVLSYETLDSTRKFLAVDEGLLTKTGSVVTVTVRNAIAGTDLGQLRQSIEHEIKSLESRERDVRNTLAKLESGFIRSLEKFRQI